MLASILFKLSFLSRFFSKLVVEKTDSYTIYKVFNGLYVQSEQIKYYFIFNKKYSSKFDVNHAKVYIHNGKNIFFQKIHMPFISKYNNDLPDFNMFSVQLKISQFILDFVYNNPFENSDSIYHKTIFKDIKKQYKEKPLSFKIARLYSDEDNKRFPFLKLLITVPDMYVSNHGHYIFNGRLYQELSTNDKITKAIHKINMYTNTHAPDIFFNAEHYFVSYFQPDSFNLITFYDSYFEHKKMSLNTFNEEITKTSYSDGVDSFVERLVNQIIANNANGLLYERLESLGYELDCNENLTVDDLVVLDMLEY